jgi:chemotaxis protein MotB
MEDEVKCEPGAPGWVVTFGDMMSLLLTFFILLLSFAKLEKSRFKVFAIEMKKAFGVDNVTPQQTFEDGRSPTMQYNSLPFDASDTIEDIQNIVEQHKTMSPDGQVDVEVSDNDRGVTLTVPYDSMFESGSSKIRENMWYLLDGVARKLQKNDAQVRVSAFTDNTPINSRTYATNDHLSAARAVAVVKYLLQVGNSTGKLPVERFESVPFGESHPKNTNVTELNRRRNRRIEIQIYQRLNKVE